MKGDGRCVRMIAVLGRDRGHARWVLARPDIVEQWRRAGLEVDVDLREEVMSPVDAAGVPKPTYYAWRRDHAAPDAHPKLAQWAREVEAQKSRQTITVDSVTTPRFLELQAKNRAWRMKQGLGPEIA